MRLLVSLAHFLQPPRNRKHQRKSVLGDRVLIDTRNVTYRHAVALAFEQVNVIIARRPSSDEFYSRMFIEKIRVDMRMNENGNNFPVDINILELINASQTKVRKPLPKEIPLGDLRFY
jgi:hypothetical protein